MFSFYAPPDALASLVEQVQHCSSVLAPTAITNRGVQVWPEGFPETFCSDHWRCRFEMPNGRGTQSEAIVALLSELLHGPHEIIKTEHLYDFDGAPSYSLA